MKYSRGSNVKLGALAVKALGNVNILSVGLERKMQVNEDVKVITSTCHRAATPSWKLEALASGKLLGDFPAGGENLLFSAELSVLLSQQWITG